MFFCVPPNKSFTTISTRSSAGMDEEDWEAEDEEDNDDGDDDVDDDADGDADDHGGDGDDSNRSKAKARKDGGSTAGSVQGSPKKKRKGAAKATREARDRSAIEIVTAQDCRWGRERKAYPSTAQLTYWYAVNQQLCYNSSTEYYCSFYRTAVFSYQMNR